MDQKESRRKWIVRGLQGLCLILALVSAFVAGVLFSRDPELAKFEILPARPKAVVHISGSGAVADMSQDFTVYSEGGVENVDGKVRVGDLKKPLSVFNDKLEVELVFDEAPVAAVGTSEPEQPSGAPSALPTKQKIVASANGTKYYFEDCKEVARIKPENIVSFTNEQEARAAGYEPSSCVLKASG